MSSTTRLAGTSPTPDSNSFADSGALVCADCQRPNAIERRFCTGCGAGLWAECPKCQAPHARSERFCGQCGLDIQRELSAAREQFDQRFGQARRLQEQLEFDEAQRALAPLLGIKDPRLAPLVEQARAASREFSADQARLQRQAQDDFAAAGQHAARFAYERATAAIEAIPSRMRTSEMTALLEDCRRRTREMLGLSGEIRDLLAAKRGIEALPKLERLVTLKPDHAEARKRIEQLVAKLLDTARKKLAVRDYDRAAELVRSIPPGLHDDLAREILAATADVEWLRGQLSRERLATPQLLALADRLATLCPNDAELARRRAELAKAVATEPDQPWRGAAPAPESESIVSGVQVEWLAGSQRLHIADAA
ncbi:MAG TPA: zinc ribbon domain-containing protein, partial [Pirellulaceae bacterium]|nr:zinc ribbon domain-containing protein [Pirellulaceae bacterium]